MGKKHKKVWRAVPLCLFCGQFGAKGIDTAFDNEIFSAHRMKCSFICSLWSLSNVYSRDRDRSLIDFLTWNGV